MFDIIERVLQRVLKKKSLQKSTSLETKLSRCLSVYQLFFYAVSIMAGAGIYILAGHVIKNRAGSSTNLSFLIGGISAFFTGLCYCELATLMPQAGSCYTYTYVLIGELPAFLIAWTLIMDCIISLSSVSKGFSGVINMVTNDAIGNFTRSYLPLSSNSEIWDSSVDLVAASLIFILFLITISGVNISFQINSVLQSVQIICLVTITIAFFIYGSKSNFIADGGYMPFGFSGIIQGAGIAVFAYSGFECVANCAEEMKNPKKSIPIALFGSLFFVILLYFSVTTGLSYMVPRLQIYEKAPFVAAFENKGLISFKWIAVVGTLIATGATKLSIVYIIGRVIYAVAKDGLIFRFLGNVNETTKVPILALLVGCFFSIILALFVKIETLADITSMGILISFIAAGINLLILRYLFGEEVKGENDSEFLKMRFLLHPLLNKRRAFVINLLVFLFSILLMQISFIFIAKLNLIVGLSIFGIMLCLVIISFIMLCFYEPSEQNDTFQTPLMPIAPVITICINAMLLLFLPADTWIRFFIWTAIGVFIYFAYGIRNTVSDDSYEILSEDNSKIESIPEEKKVDK